MAARRIEYQKRPKLTDPRQTVRQMIDPSIQLSGVTGMTIDLYCQRCNHHAETTSTALMKRHGGAAFLGKVLQNARCSGCGHKGVPDIRLRPQRYVTPDQIHDGMDDEET